MEVVGYVILYRLLPLLTLRDHGQREAGEYVVHDVAEVYR